MPNTEIVVSGADWKSDERRRSGERESKKQRSWSSHERKRIGWLVAEVGLNVERHMHVMQITWCLYYILLFAHRNFPTQYDRLSRRKLGFLCYLLCAVRWQRVVMTEAYFMSVLTAGVPGSGRAFSVLHC